MTALSVPAAFLSGSPPPPRPDVSATTQFARWPCAVFALISWLMVMGLTGCSWQIIPPESASPEATVYVSLYGRHTRLALPGDGVARYIEYGFGDWRYYAQAERSTWSGLRALFASDSSALSRREVLIRPGVEAATAFRSQRSTSLSVSAVKVSELRRELEQAWSQSEGRSLQRGDHVYREVPWRYGLLNNSNRRTARWLRQLGCDIEGFPLLGDFTVARKFHQMPD